MPFAPQVQRQWRLHLKDGTPVLVVRPGADDAGHDADWLRERIKEGYAHLSVRSRRQRFVSAPRRLAEWQLDYLSDLDPARGAVWVAGDDSTPRRAAVGLARCVCMPGEPGCAEFALTVLDAYQNRGMGGWFLALIRAYARDAGIRLLRGYVLPENRPMLHLLRREHALAPVDEGGLLRIDWPTGE